jgi:hypothetical protein
MIKHHAGIGLPPKSCSIVDTLSRDGATALAKRLQQYWHDFAKIGSYRKLRARSCTA